MAKKKHISYNPYFLFPFLAWVVAGGIALAVKSQRDLFFAVNSHYAANTDIFMYYTAWMGQAEIIIPVLLLLMVIPRFRNWWYLATALACNIIPFLVQHFLKTWFNSPRPLLVYVENTGEHYPVHYLPTWPHLLHTSFPSGHSQGAFSFFCFLSLLLPRQYRIYGFVFFIMALMVCYSRLYLAAHFFGDVYAGSILGAILTTLIFAYMDKNKRLFFRQKKEISVNA